ncbi:hypothetical protein RD792_017962 [Penstemon davidsonii]|uniref:NAC domain-containing protein n=1 Tax=Penstemon davidsonii TaxID=160366 RepID=A0ABR0DW89_9LAMI|nr:hypothetical protein RD792_017962 [Penstemon davidsonii]
MGLKDIGNTLPPGFRFYPSDEELVCHYLYKKIINHNQEQEEGEIDHPKSGGTLVEIDLHTCEPWQLPGMYYYVYVAKLNSNEWYFFSFRDRKYATGFRTNRATISGYWKATGKDRSVLDPRTRAVVGMRKTLVFYKNRAPNGIKSGWIMHEFRLENPHVPPKEDWVLCRVFYKSRGENNNKYSPHENFFDSSTVGATSSNLAPSPTNEHLYIPSAYQNNFSHSQTHDHQNPTISIGLSPLITSYDLSHHETKHEPHQLSISSFNNHTKCEDDYGFLFDMSFDDSNAVPSSLEDIRFEDNNNAVFKLD